MNVHTLNGRMSPAFDTNYLNTTDRLHYYVRAIEYKSGTDTGSIPRQYAGVNKSIFRLDNGNVTE